MCVNGSPPYIILSVKLCEWAKLWSIKFEICYDLLFLREKKVSQAIEWLKPSYSLYKKFWMLNHIRPAMLPSLWLSNPLNYMSFVLNHLPSLFPKYGYKMPQNPRFWWLMVLDYSIRKKKLPTSELNLITYNCHRQVFNDSTWYLPCGPLWRMYNRYSLNVIGVYNAGRSCVINSRIGLSGISAFGL